MAKSLARLTGFITLTISKSPGDERALIIRQPAKRPYGSRLRVHLQTAASMGLDGGVTLLLDSGQFVTISPARKAPWEGGDRFAFELQGFSTASAAEAGGLQLVQALLWTAVSMQFPVRFEYSTTTPTIVYDRTRSGGIDVEGYGTVGWSAKRVLDEVCSAYSGLGTPDPVRVLSLEIFAGARIEVSDRARFLAIVSALEPLATPRRFGSGVNDFVDSCVARLDGEHAVPNADRPSLHDRLQHLRTESVRQSILRLVREALPGRRDAVSIVDRAYAVRSEIVHRGRPADPDLDLEACGREVGGVLRELYAALLNRDLYRAG